MDKNEVKIENNMTVKRRDAQKQAYANRILRSAEEIFFEKGFQYSSTEEIAARAGVTKRTLYNHFPSKMALYTGIYQTYLNSLKRKMSQVAKLSLPTDQLILKYFETFYKFSRKNKNFMHLFLLVLKSDKFEESVPYELRNKVGKQIDEMYRIIIEHIKLASKDGKELNIEPQLLLHVVMAIHKGIFIHGEKDQRFNKYNITPDKLFDLFKIVLKEGVIRSSSDISKVTK